MSSLNLTSEIFFQTWNNEFEPWNIEIYGKECFLETTFTDHEVTWGMIYPFLITRMSKKLG
jgi:hypothetical protein